MGANLGLCTAAKFIEDSEICPNEIIKIFKFLNNFKRKNLSTSILSDSKKQLNEIKRSIEIKYDDMEEIRNIPFIFNKFLLSGKEEMIKYKISRYLENFDIKKDIFKIAERLVIKHYTKQFLLDEDFSSKLILLNSKLKIKNKQKFINDFNNDPSEESLSQNKELIKFFEDVFNFKSIVDSSSLNNYIKVFQFNNENRLSSISIRILDIFLGLRILNKGGYLDNTGKAYFKVYDSMEKKISKIIKERCFHEEDELIKDNFDNNFFQNNEEECIISMENKEIVKEKDKIKAQNLSNILKFDEEINSYLCQKETNLPSLDLDYIVPNKSEDRIFKKKSNKYTYYSGDYDTLNFRSAGKGILIKPSISIYEGIFKDGKKCGYGYYFKNKSKSYDYYLGEWESNKYNGYGILYSFKSDMKVIRKGIFKNGIISSGKIIKITEIGNEIKLETYKGIIGNNSSYHSKGRISRTIIKKNNNEYYIESLYFYNGELKDNVENGKGLSVKILPSLDFMYLYKGDFILGKMEGEGTIIFDGDFSIRKYEGIFEQDRWFYKYGKIYYRSGEFYEGFFDTNHSNFVLGIITNYNDYSKFERNITRSGFDDSFSNMFKLYKNISDKEFEEINNKIQTNFSGDLFLGQFQDGQKQGFGKSYLKEDNIITLGNYNRGIKEGIFISIRHDESFDLIKKKYLQYLKFDDDKLIKCVKKFSY